MADYFYLGETLYCPLCGSALILKPRETQPDSMKLVHGDGAKCARSGKVYYCPGREMTEIPKGFQ